MTPIELLRSIGLEQYERSFLENDVDESVLGMLSDQDLRELGVFAMGHRKKILAAVALAGYAPVANMAGYHPLTGAAVSRPASPPSFSATPTPTPALQPLMPVAQPAAYVPPPQPVAPQPHSQVAPAPLPEPIPEPIAAPAPAAARRKPAEPSPQPQPAPATPKPEPQSSGGNDLLELPLPEKAAAPLPTPGKLDQTPPAPSAPQPQPIPSIPKADTPAPPEPLKLIESNSDEPPPPAAMRRRQARQINVQDGVQSHTPPDHQKKDHAQNGHSHPALAEDSEQDALNEPIPDIDFDLPPDPLAEEGISLFDDASQESPIAASGTSANGYDTEAAPSHDGSSVSTMEESEPLSTNRLKNGIWFNNKGFGFPIHEEKYSSEERDFAYILSLSENMSSFLHEHPEVVIWIKTNPPSEIEDKTAWMDDLMLLLMADGWNVLWRGDLTTSSQGKGEILSNLWQARDCILEHLDWPHEHIVNVQQLWKNGESIHNEPRAFQIALKDIV